MLRDRRDEPLHNPTVLARVLSHRPNLGQPFAFSTSLAQVKIAVQSR
jgi:hypothetical protein